MPLTRSLLIFWTVGIEFLFLVWRNLTFYCASRKDLSPVWRESSFPRQHIHHNWAVKPICVLNLSFLLTLPRLMVLSTGHNQAHRVSASIVALLTSIWETFLLPLLVFQHLYFIILLTAFLLLSHHSPLGTFGNCSWTPLQHYPAVLHIQF